MIMEKLILILINLCLQVEDIRGQATQLNQQQNKRLFTQETTTISLQNNVAKITSQLDECQKVLSKTQSNIDKIQDGLAYEKEQRIQLEYMAKKTMDLVNNQNELFQKKTELLEKRVEICLTSCKVTAIDHTNTTTGTVTPATRSTRPPSSSPKLTSSPTTHKVTAIDHTNTTTSTVTPATRSTRPSSSSPKLTSSQTTYKVTAIDHTNTTTGTVTPATSSTRPPSSSPKLTSSQTTYKAKDCWDIKAMYGISEDGVYDVVSPDSQKMSLRCDMTTDGGGWTIFQRRGDGSVRFDETYEEYKFVFGNLTGEFWMGNDFLNVFTRDVKQTLRVDICDWDNDTRWAKYKHFSVGPSADNYRLAVDNYNGTAGDPLIRGYKGISGYNHNGQAFSAPDVDNDNRGWGDCASDYQSGWWFNSCRSANLNGIYQPERSSHNTVQGIQWGTWISGHSLKGSEMKMRPSTSTSSSNKPFNCPVI